MKFMQSLLTLGLLTLTLLATAGSLTAEQEAAIDRAFVNADRAAITGPDTIRIKDQGTLNLQPGDRFVPFAETKALLESEGNGSLVNDNLLGMIFFAFDNYQSIALVKYEQTGHISDSDALKWKDPKEIDALYHSLEQGTERANTERAKQGFEPVRLAGWLVRPTYDKSNHQLSYALASPDQGARTAINLFNYLLNREGLFALQVITRKQSFETAKAQSDTTLRAIDIENNKRYEDYDARKDKTAAYGLAALITGIAAKKLGLLAMFGALLIKFAKFVILLPVLLWDRIKRLFKRKEASSV